MLPAFIFSLTETRVHVECSDWLAVTASFFAIVGRVSLHRFLFNFFPVGPSEKLTRITWALRGIAIL